MNFPKEKMAILSFLVAILLVRYSIASDPGYFTAAVYEHAHRDYKSPETIPQKNLEWYQRATNLAKVQGADLILFPEYGIFPPGERNEIKRYLEVIPNPQMVTVNPCNETTNYSDRPILQYLSCMAKNNSIVVVANMGGIEPCEGEPDCPADGNLHMNSNVAFDRDGTLLARYYKEKLFYEEGMDLPKEQQDPVFETSFGKFAMFICFDIMWEKMAVTSRLPDIDAILFSAMWDDILPLFMTLPWFQAWAIRNNATLLASNVQMPGYFAVGSGIFRGKEGPIATVYNPDGKFKLIVASIPQKQHNRADLQPPKITVIAENYTEPWNSEDDGKDLPPLCSYNILGKAENIYKDYRCFEESISNYTLRKLYNTSDYIKACNGDACCELNYTASNMEEGFYLGVHSGLHVFFERYFWAEEVCILVRCDDLNGTACSHFPRISNTSFQKVSMTTNFKSKDIYPSLVSSKERLVPTRDWTYEVKHNKSMLKFSSTNGVQLLVASLNGRRYDEDLPYIR